MKKFFLIFFAVILLVLVGGAGIFYLVFNDPSNREAFVASFVASGKPSFIRNCIKAAHRTAPNTGPEIDKKIENVCNCAADKTMESISSRKDSLSGMGAAIYRMVFDSESQQETVMRCLEENR